MPTYGLQYVIPNRDVKIVLNHDWETVDWIPNLVSVSKAFSVLDTVLCVFRIDKCHLTLGLLS